MKTLGIPIWKIDLIWNRFSVLFVFLMHMVVVIVEKDCLANVVYLCVLRRFSLRYVEEIVRDRWDKEYCKLQGG